MSCNRYSLKVIKYQILDEKCEVFFNSDSTYFKNCNREYSYGFWHRHKDTLAMINRYDKNKIQGVEVKSAILDTSLKTIITLKLFDENTPSYAYVILFDSITYTDTLLFINPIIISNLVDKKKNIYCKIIQPIFKLNYSYAETDVFSFSITDTVVVKYDFMFDTKNYSFNKEEFYIIDDKKQILIPLNSTSRVSPETNP